MDSSTSATATAFQWTASSMISLFGLEEASGGHDCGFFDIFASLVYLFIFLYAMAKFVLISERYLSQHMLCCKNHLIAVRSMNREWEKTLQLCEADKNRLNREVQILIEKNLQLKHVLGELRNCNLHMIKVNLLRSVPLKQPKIPSNIYITNTHFHVTRHVFINEGQLSVRNAAGGDSGNVYSEDGISSAWMKYLKMRKCYMGPIADRCLEAPPGDSVDPMLPIVMSTEQLAEMQGIM